MIGPRGWSDNADGYSPTNLLAHLLEVAAEGNPVRIADLVPEDDSFNELDVIRWATSLADDELLQLTPFTLSLTPAGHECALLHRELAGDPTRRAAACREALVSWLARCARSGTPTVFFGGFLEADEVWYFGTKFSLEDLSSAEDYLVERGLVRKVPAAKAGLGAIRLTPDGVDCAEQFGCDVVAYLTSLKSTGGATVTTHFHGPISGVVAVAGGDVQQQVQQAGSMDLEQLQLLLDNVVKSAHELSGIDPALLMTYLDVVKAEAVSAEPEPDLVRGTAQRLKDIAGRVGNAALEASVSALTTYLLKSQGL